MLATLCALTNRHKAVLRLVMTAENMEAEILHDKRVPQVCDDGSPL